MLNSGILHAVPCLFRVYHAIIRYGPAADNYQQTYDYAILIKAAYIGTEGSSWTNFG